MAKILPILMNGEMVRAVRKDLKTQTRRVIQPQPQIHELIKGTVLSHCPSLERAPYQPGNVLWVRETWAEIPGGGGAVYRATWREDGWGKGPNAKWTPSIHMPKWAARLFLRVTNVRVQQLQNISQTDAAAEGLPREFDEELLGFGEKVWKFFAPDGSEHGDPRCAFMRLWDSLAKPGTKFDDNPWVWVYEFEKCDKPEGWPNA